MLKKVWVRVLSLLIWGVLSLRYRVRVRGIQNLSPAQLTRKGGILFLPNHPAEIDPLILILKLWEHYEVHPLVVEQFYYLKGIQYFQKLVGAIPIPDLNGSVNKWKQKKVEECFQTIAKGLKEGKHYLIYPSGKLKQEGLESVGGASFVYNLVQECPEVNIVLIRTTGLWGSRFSRAVTGSTPNFGEALWQEVKVILKNLIFFAPKYEVTVEIEVASPSFPRQVSKLEFNQALEHWYNLHGAEPLERVSDHFWNQYYPQIVKAEAKKNLPSFSISPQIEKEILDKICLIAKKQSVRRSDDLAADLGLDSLDTAQMETFLIERFEMPSLSFEGVQTVEDVLRLVSSPIQTPPSFQKKTLGWPKEKSRPSPLPPQGTSIQEAFLRACDRWKGHAASADDRVGVLSYRKLKLMAFTLKDRFCQLEGQHVGVLLPASSVSYIIVLALLLAGKTPVMLNWTVGPRALNHCRKTAQFKVALTSRKFLDHLADGDLGELDNLLLFIEDVKESLSFRSRLKGICALLKKTPSLLKELGPTSPNDPAVILFTSGTESLPKGVPLSHHNILANHRAGMECLDLLSSDVLYGILPPFHSFGFSVTGLLPLLAGIKVFYAPDPTQYFSMVHDIETWGVTLFCSAPTFIKGAFQVAKPEQLKSLRLVVGGAEKTSEELFQAVKNLGIEMMEGYGITECSPIITFTRPGKRREGVGEPIPGVDLCILNPETHENILDNSDGEICIHGPNVFNGYLGSVPAPFIEKEGKRWYCSGDLGHLTPSGALVLSGRLKRFIKIGGEMISLAAVEEALNRTILPKNLQEGGLNHLAVVAVEGVGDKSLIVLFSSFEVTKERANEALRENGFGRIIKVSAVQQIPQIPLTGAGKTHYHALQEMVKRETL